MALKPNIGTRTSTLSTINITETLGRSQVSFIKLLDYHLTIRTIINYNHLGRKFVRN